MRLAYQYTYIRSFTHFYKNKNSDSEPYKYSNRYRNFYKNGQPESDNNRIRYVYAYGNSNKNSKPEPVTYGFCFCVSNSIIDKFQHSNAKRDCFSVSYTDRF